MNRNLIIATALALLVGAGGGYWLARSTGPAPEATTGKSGEREVLFYRNPMNPAITSPAPAKDEMGMDYIPVFADEAGGGGEAPVGTVKIDPVIEQNIGVRTAVAERMPLSHTIQTVGRLAYDERGMTRLHPKVEGWVEDLRVSETGQRVRRGDVLASIYSPQLVATQQEYVLALNNRDTLAESKFPDIRQGADDMVRSARQRLRLLDVPPAGIRRIEETREVTRTLHIRSPFDGIAASVGIREGQYVTPKDELYMLADLSKIWVLVDVFENELPWLRLGDTTRMQLRGIPGRTFEGTVTYIYPYLENRTRSVKARLEFDNPDLLLKPDMYADVTVHTARQPEAVVVPTRAILRPGLRPQVFVVRAPGKFEPRDVELGVSSKGLTQILSGVEAGESVVTSAQFLIDSESKLREATAKMLEAAGSRKGTRPGTDREDMGPTGNHAGHEGMDMSGQPGDQAPDHGDHE